MLGVVSQSFLSVCSDAAHLRFLPHQPSKLPFFKPIYLYRPIAAAFRCLVISTEGASLPIGVTAPNQSNPLISLLHSYGFSDDQVSWIFHKRCQLVAADPEKTIRPKLDYFLSFGYSQSELVTLISAYPILLMTSLENRIARNISRLEQLLGSRELVKYAIARSGRLLRCNYDKCIAPNMEILRIHGVPDKRIVQVVSTFPKAILQEPEVTNTVVTELKNLGMDPSSRAFTVAFRAKSTLLQRVWDSRVACYKSFGWSDEDLLSAFKKHPYCMLHSERKITKMVNFYIEKLGWDPVFLAEKPILIDLSLEDRVLPRCVKLNVLASMGLLQDEKSLPTLLLMKQKSFEAFYVNKYRKDISDVRKAYESTLEKDFKALRAWDERRRKKKSEGKN